MPWPSDTTPGVPAIHRGDGLPLVIGPHGETVPPDQAAEVAAPTADDGSEGLLIRHVVAATEVERLDALGVEDAARAEFEQAPGEVVGAGAGQG